MKLSKKFLKNCSFKNIFAILFLIYLIYYSLKFSKVIETFNDCNTSKEKENLSKEEKEEMSKIKNLTNEFLDELIIKKRPKIAKDKYMCSNSTFTIDSSRTKKTGKDLIPYLEFVSNLPGIEIKCIEHNVTKINNDVYNNIAFITWKWEELDDFKNSKFIFTFKNINDTNCINNIYTTSLPKMSSDKSNKLLDFFNKIVEQGSTLKSNILNINS